MAKIGFIGTGIMGKPMAQNLQKAGHSLFLSTHHDAAPADLLEAGAIPWPTRRKWPRKPSSSSSWCRTPRRSRMCCSARTVSPRASARTRW